VVNEDEDEDDCDDEKNSEEDICPIDFDQDIFKVGKRPKEQIATDNKIGSIEPPIPDTGENMTIKEVSSGRSNPYEKN